MKKIKIINFLTILSLPFSFVSCSYLWNTKSPNPIEAANDNQLIGGYYENGMKYWENIKHELSNQAIPDYCIFSVTFGSRILRCSQRIDMNKSFDESEFINTSCKLETHSTERSCLQSSSKGHYLDDLKEYKRYMAYAGNGEEPESLKDKFIIISRNLLGSAAFLSLLAFPFLLVGSLIYLIKTIKKKFKK